MASINYFLLENKLKDGAAPSYAARIITNQTIEQKDLINLMADSNTTVSRQDIIVVMDLLEEVITRELLLGNRINTNLFKASVSIKGIFDEKTSEFDRNMHSFRVNLNAKPALKKAIQHNAVVAKKAQKYAIPDLAELFDVASESFGQYLTRGGAAELKGSRLSFDGEDLNQGLFLKHESEDRVVRIEKYHAATPSRIFFTVPADLEDGNYSLVVRNLRGKKLQEELFTEMLTAA